MGEKREAEEKGEERPESKSELRTTSRRLREEIAGLRLGLRNTYNLAMEALEAEEET